MRGCVMCKGTLNPGVVNHIVDIGSQIIIVRNVPAMVCDQCGESFYADEHMRKLEELVQNAKLQGMEIAIMDYANVAA